MAARASTELRADPNLTPMLDLVFQLITFFVLIFNFKSAEIDQNLQLPVVGSARPVETHGQVDLTVLNVNSDGDLMVYGHPVKNIEGYIVRESQSSMLANRMTQADLDEGKELPTTVVIRADRSTPFRMINRIIKSCQDNGFRSFALKAMNKEQ
ncbi:MAG: biopolymer transporter ExbD [Pirellulaceae bacterium]|nr:biopolymer transporter ExbD [Pirellulaceae bacterium]